MAVAYIVTLKTIYITFCNHDCYNNEIKLPFRSDRLLHTIKQKTQMSKQRLPMGTSIISINEEANTHRHMMLKTQTTNTNRNIMPVVTW